MAKFYYYEWTPEEDNKLREIMTTGGRTKVLTLFKEAAEKLQRTAKSCQNRWYEIREERKKGELIE